MFYSPLLHVHAPMLTLEEHHDPVSGQVRYDEMAPSGSVREENDGKVIYMNNALSHRMFSSVTHYHTVLLRYALVGHVIYLNTIDI